MPKINIQSVNSLLQHHSNNPTLQSLRLDLEKAQQAELSCSKLDKIIHIYRQALPIIEEALWSSEINDTLISQYQKSFQELEQFISLRGCDDRHDFIIVIPVADRPTHLSKCMESLLKLCQCYMYGGFSNQSYSKVSVIISDDSVQQGSIAQHREIAHRFNKLGLRTEYFGAKEQINILAQLGTAQWSALKGVLGPVANKAGTSKFAHKGASIMRNITYLRLNQIINDINRDRTLIYFIDSDQEFCVNATVHNGSRNVYAINYFHHLDEIFTHTDAGILTGKVVGDPPVSPAVMAGTFQDDVIDFLGQIADSTPDQPCQFHQTIEQKADDAAYHDMAELFGFSNTTASIRYNCTLNEPHSNADCFHDFAGKLNHFFHGEHPTRQTYFHYEQRLSKTSPARTIYTGNYVFRPEYLKYFISFATLKLRMAGPALGRILKAEVKQRFVSANLPMLHTRTIGQTGQSEFRPGVTLDSACIDLSEEFERQFYGDVMLFTVDKLTQQGYPESQLPEAMIRQMLDETEAELHTQYRNKHRQIIEKLTVLEAAFKHEHYWWNQLPGATEANKAFDRFIRNITYNFNLDSPGYRLINSADNMARRNTEILQAIMNYTNERSAWQEALQ